MRPPAVALPADVCVDALTGCASPASPPSANLRSPNAAWISKTQPPSSIASPSRSRICARTTVNAASSAMACSRLAWWLSATPRDARCATSSARERPTTVATPASRRSLGSDLERVDAHAVKPHEYGELPELTDAMLARVVVNRGGRPRSASPRQLISLRLPPEVIERWRATGPGGQTRMAERLAKVPAPRVKRGA